ncbi:MAG TPA: tetratricopeptide repeat protein [Bryobacteraceae bacterium]|nr:tetratricopeptide repeat protein [Bryobacteraceae bacterium]
MIRRLLICTLLAAPALFAADVNKDIVELQREIAGLADQIKSFQRSLEDKLAVLSQKQGDQGNQIADQVNKTMSGIADRLQKTVQDQRDQQTQTNAAVAGLSAQLQGLSSDLSTVKGALTDLAAAMSKLSTQMTDLGNAVKALQPPPAAQPAAAAARPDISAIDLFANAERDRMGGHLDVALSEYTLYLQMYPNTPQAADAQYQVGSIHYSNHEWQDAVTAFDVVLEKYADNKQHAAEALYYKGDCLGKLGRWTESGEAMKELRRRFPNSSLARQSLSIRPPGR